METERSYGPVQPTPGYLQLLHHYVHPHDELKKAGYIFSKLSSTDLQRKKRCEKCCKVLKKERQRNQPGEPKLPPASDAAMAGQNHIDLHNSNRASNAAVTESQISPHTKQALDTAAKGIERTRDGSSGNTSFICSYHPGQVANRKWTCCNGPLFSKPCAGQHEHSPRHYNVGELEKNWQFYETKTVRLPTHVAAVVLDCEMGMASSGESELIRLSVVDFFTGAVLIDSLVYPSVKMAHYNTRFSGVTKHSMENSRRHRKCILGRDSARQALYKFVGPDTVVIGHAGHQDLTSLRWTHHRIVDTLILETRKRRFEADMARRKEWEESEKKRDGRIGKP
ncbi:hypothetical protein J3459_008174 [Metarhizium acridum]|nr:hypothetical protein J3459_008174 [Metarhizium acridum]